MLTGWTTGQLPLAPLAHMPVNVYAHVLSMVVAHTSTTSQQTVPSHSSQTCGCVSRHCCAFSHVFAHGCCMHTWDTLSRTALTQPCPMMLPHGCHTHTEHISKDGPLSLLWHTWDTSSRTALTQPHPMMLPHGCHTHTEHI